MYWTSWTSICSDSQYSDQQHCNDQLTLRKVESETLKKALQSSLTTRLVRPVKIPTQTSNNLRGQTIMVSVVIGRVKTDVPQLPLHDHHSLALSLVSFWQRSLLSSDSSLNCISHSSLRLVQFSRHFHQFQWPNNHASLQSFVDRRHSRWNRVWYHCWKHRRLMSVHAFKKHILFFNPKHFERFQYGNVIFLPYVCIIFTVSKSPIPFRCFLLIRILRSAGEIKIAFWSKPVYRI